jgi:hypothetical protein
VFGPWPSSTFHLSVFSDRKLYTVTNHTSLLPPRAQTRHLNWIEGTRQGRRIQIGDAQRQGRRRSGGGAGVGHAV